MLVFHLGKQISARTLWPWSGALQAEIPKPHAASRIPSASQAAAPGVRLWGVQRSFPRFRDALHHRGCAGGHLWIHTHFEQRGHGESRYMARGPMAFLPGHMWAMCVDGERLPLVAGRRVLSHAPCFPSPSPTVLSQCHLQTLPHFCNLLNLVLYPALCPGSLPSPMPL